MNRIRVVTKTFTVNEQNELFIINKRTEQLDFLCGVIGEDLECEQPKREEIVIDYCDCCNRFFLIMNGNSYEFTPSDQFTKMYRHIQKLTTNNYRKMHHIPMFRWKGMKKGKVK